MVGGGYEFFWALFLEFPHNFIRKILLLVSNNFPPDFPLYFCFFMIFSKPNTRKKVTLPNLFLSTKFSKVQTELKKNNDNPQLFMVVYASLCETLHQNLWLELSSFGQMYKTPWLLVADSKATKNIGERFNCSEDLSRRCSNFNFWIKNNHLLDPGFAGPQCTWA